MERAAMAELDLISVDTPGRVIDDISPRDTMFTGNREHYFEVAESGLRCIRLAMTAAGKEGATRILDLPCGHGRILRMLKAAFPEAELTACDIDRDAVDFCAATFGAMPVYSVENPDELQFGESFDLIWCGSLLTHLDRGWWEGFLALFERALAPGGVLVFTTHGRHVANRLRKRNLKHGLGLTEETTESLLSAYERNDFGFTEYAAQTGYGISLASPAWICGLLAKRPSLRLVTFTERGFGARGLQDSIGVVRAN
jgi:SAM-dependent methyltransferase